MPIANALTTSYFSFAAKFIHLIDDYCENLDARLKQQPRITKCDEIKVTLLKALIKRVAAIALIAIACLDLLIELGSALFCKGRQARNIIGTIATIFKSVACILTGQLPGVTYDLYQEGVSGALRQMVVEPLANDKRLYQYDFFEARTPRSLGKCTRNLKRILKHISATTQNREVWVLSNPIGELINLKLSSLNPMIQLMMKHQRGKESFTQNVIPFPRRFIADFNVGQWTEIVNTILGQIVSNDDIWALLERIGPPLEERNFSKCNMLCSLFNKALENRDLDARIANRIILYVTNRLVVIYSSRATGGLRANGLSEIEETTSRLINHPGSTPEMLSQLAASWSISTTIREKLLNKCLEMAILTPPETPINPLIRETTFRLSMLLPLKDDKILRIQEFYKKYQTQVVSLLHLYTDSYLIEGHDILGYRPDNMRMLLNMLINQFPLKEREITAIFKTAVVILDYRLVRQILDNPERRSFFDKDFMIAIGQGLQNALRRKDESVLQLLDSIPASGLSSPNKLFLKNLLDASGNTTLVINWIIENYARFIGVVAGVQLFNVREDILQMCEQVDKEQLEKERKDKAPSTLLSFRNQFIKNIVDIEFAGMPNVILGMITDYYSPNATEIPLSAKEREEKEWRAAFAAKPEDVDKYLDNFWKLFEERRRIRDKESGDRYKILEEERLSWEEESKAAVIVQIEDVQTYYNSGDLKRSEERRHIRNYESQRVVDMIRILRLTFQKPELNEREVQRIIKTLTDPLQVHLFRVHERIVNSVIKLINHPIVQEQWLCDIAQSSICPERLVPLCCSRFLAMPSLSPKAVEIVFRFCMGIKNKDPFHTSNLAKIQEFYQKYRGQIATHLNEFADEFLIKGKDNSECNRENVRTLLSTLIEFYPLTEREIIRAIFKAAVVIFDYELVKAIVENPARRAFLDKEFLLATYQAFELGAEQAPLELLDRLFTYRRNENPGLEDPFIIESKLKLKEYFNITKKTAPIRAWLTRNHCYFMDVKDIRLASQICDMCQDIEARKQMESQQKIENSNEGERKEEIETKRTSEREGETKHKQESETKRINENAPEAFRKKFLGLVIKYGEIFPSAPVPAEGGASVDRILNAIEGY